MDDQAAAERKVLQAYVGDGTTIGQRGATLPPLQPPRWLDDPSGYIAEDGLRDAVNVALVLGQPLLVTGEPGTGKTELAASIAYELELPPPLVFDTKSTSTSRDLFYRYDSLRHFHDAQYRREQASVDQYIEYEALGLAILLAMAPSQSAQFLPERLRGSRPVRSVVLIDEIDKAPRDLPNDVLNEIERMAFTVKETGRTFAADYAYKPIVVLTSNSEKDLPDAFLRRCVFFHISFPSRARLREIVQRRLEPSAGFSPAMIDHALAHFEEIRALGLRKKPSTAELLSWMHVLAKLRLDVAKLKPGEAEALAFTYAILAKNREDMALLQQRIS